MALVALSVIEQRYRAVIAVLGGAQVSEVAAEAGVSRQSVHAWVAGYRATVHRILVATAWSSRIRDGVSGRTKCAGSGRR